VRGGARCAEEWGARRSGVRGGVGCAEEWGARRSGLRGEWGTRGQPEMLGPARVMVMRTTQRRSLIMAAR
jgi:hypothetical protein